MAILQIMENISMINNLYFHNFNISAALKNRSTQAKSRAGRVFWLPFDVLKKIHPEPFQTRFEPCKYVWQSWKASEIHAEAALAPWKGDATIRPSN